MTERTVILRDTSSPTVILREPKFAIVPLASADSAAAHRAVLEAIAQADRSEDEADRAEVARSGAEAAEAGTIAAIDGVVLDAAILNAATRVVLAALDTTLGLPAYLTEAGRAGMFKWTTGDHSARIALDTDQGIYIESDDVAATSGAWVRQFDGDLYANWFGVGPAFSASVNATSLNLAIQVIKAYFAVTGAGYATGSRRLRIQAGVHQLNAAVVIDYALAVIGDFPGMFSGGGTVLQFTTSCHGIDIETTVGWCRIEGLFLDGNAAVDSGFYGIRARGKIIARDMFIKDFDHGIHCDGTPGYNVNGSSFENIAIQGCGWATWAQGPNGNNIHFFNVSGIANQLGGHMDASFLGNIYIGGDLSSNGGINNSTQKNRCHVAGHIYMCMRHQEAWCSTNAPTGAATSNQGWLYVGEGSAAAYQPTWTTAQTWYFSAPFAMDPSNNNARSVFRDMYIEPDQNPSIMTWPGVYYRGFDVGVTLYNDGSRYSGVISVGFAGEWSMGDVRLRALNGKTCSFKPDTGTSALYLDNNSNFVLGHISDPGYVTGDLVVKLKSWGANGQSFQFLDDDVVWGSYGAIATAMVAYGPDHLWRSLAGALWGQLNATGLSLYGGDLRLDNLKGVYVNGTKVVGNQQAVIGAPAGGATIDAEARTAINAIRAALTGFGLTG